MNSKVDGYRSKFEENVSILPGRLGNNGISFVRFGNTETYFYMTTEKHAATHKLITLLNAKKIHLVADVYENPRSTEFSAIASILPDPRGDRKNDPTGQKALDEYADVVTEIGEKIFRVPKFFGVSRELNLIVSHDAHSYHHDSFPKQYEFLKKKPEFGKATLIHDLTLADWDMAKGTISGTIFQDPVSGDRFLFALLPQDQFATMTFEPVNYEVDGITPKDPGAKHLPFHAVLSPEDLYGDTSSGSSKGQRVSSVLRGVISNLDLDDLHLASKELSLNTPKKQLENCAQILTYSNGIIFRQILDSHSSEIIKITGYTEIENITVMAIESSSFQKGYQIIKKDGGFNSLGSLISVNDTDKILIYNRSILPNGYKHYPISEDQSDLGCPWIQMYRFPDGYSMEMDGLTFKRLSLTPVLELIYRDEEACSSQERALISKLQTNLFLYVSK